jgi:micrococcal nuclease
VVARLLVPVLVVIASSVAGCDSAASSSSSMAPGVVETNAVIESVVDGDTIDVTIDGRDERVRLIGIDTPETKKPNTPVECFGPEATDFIESLLPAGTGVRIERDVVGRDDYGRLLGYIYRGDDGIFVNYEIVRQGFARPLTIAPNINHERLFVSAARSADDDDVGLWAACSG